jgi:hypothetical protein
MREDLLGVVRGGAILRVEVAVEWDLDHVEQGDLGPLSADQQQSGDDQRRIVDQLVTDERDEDPGIVERAMVLVGASEEINSGSYPTALPPGAGRTGDGSSPGQRP